MIIDYENSNRLSYTQDAATEGTAQVVWDGDDNNATVISRTGLSGVDLTDGDTNDGFLVQVIFDDLEIDLTFKVYTGTNWSESTIRLPGGIAEATNRMDVFFPFSGFTIGGGTGAVLTSTGAVVMEIDGTVAASADLTLDMVESNSDREYGDLPASYGTAITTANHIPQVLRLGNNLDTESDGQPNASANGDDTADSPDDEDGVQPTPSQNWSVGVNGGSIDVTVEGCSGTCYLNGWINWNSTGDSDFGDTGEPVLNDYGISNGADQTIPITIPTGTDVTDTYFFARFRLCDATGECNTATAQNVTNGEVEDYKWSFGPTAVTLRRLEAISVPSRFPVGPAAAALALLASGIVVGGVVVRRRRR